MKSRAPIHLSFNRPKSSSLNETTLGIATLSRNDISQPHLLLSQLIQSNAATPPYPAHGFTLNRWKILSAVAHFDLSLAKMYEGHTDAKAIVYELLGISLPDSSTWGVWCADPPNARVVQVTTLQKKKAPLTNEFGFDQPVRLTGTKAWCSGAGTLTHALVGTYDETNNRKLVAVKLDQPEIEITDIGWSAVGMPYANSYNVIFHNALGFEVAGSNRYIDRPGFWHGGAGIAACWYGGATKLADITKHFVLTGRSQDPHKLAHLGAIDVALTAASTVLRETAAFIDANPLASAEYQCRKVRLVVEEACNSVLEHSGKALGATAFCKNEEFARMHADLTVFLRQSHADADSASVATLLTEHHSWAL